ncbi:MAG: hypothetical protein KA007_01865 [Candidatus Pacebacteria bacterium]|nr:hypothetical protein [Candidatus Paceibacterota bacterium]
MQKEPSKSKVCRLDWTAEKIKKIIKVFAKNSKDEALKKEHSDFEEFLEHCSISGEILELIISDNRATQNYYYFRKVLTNQTLTTNQIMALFEEKIKNPDLLEDTGINSSFANHPNSPKHILGSVSKM